MPKNKLRGKPVSPRFLTLLLALGFILSVLIRLLIGGVGVSHSPLAGLVFAACLIGMTIVVGTRFTISKQAVLIGLIGGAVLCLPPLIHRLITGAGHQPQGNYIAWAIVVSLVALAEEAFLRGTLFDAVFEWKGQNAAIIAASLAFTVLHIPLYGLNIIPLEFVVGIWLGALRVVSKTAVAPGIAHVFADLAGWWIR